jgi:hypothetical protein
MTEIRGNRFGLNQAPEEILGFLEEIATGYGLTSTKEYRYYFWDWKTLHRINWQSLQSIKKYLGAQRRDPRLNTFLSRCGAEYIQLKNHYLGFYPIQGVIIKIFLDQDAFSRHVEGVQRFNELQNRNLKAPKILSHGLSPYLHTRERYITGKNFQLLALDLKADLIAELAAFHYRQVGEVEEVISDAEKTRILESLRKIGLDREQLDWIRNFLKPSTWKVLEGDIHGDINRGNLIQGEDAVYLTDWEYFSRGPIAEDMVKIYSQAGERLRHVILTTYQDKLNMIDDKCDSRDFRSSLLLYTLKSLPSLYQESREQLVQVLKDQTKIDLKIADYEQIILGSIQSLLAASENH